jgi:hypothetical protein
MDDRPDDNQVIQVITHVHTNASTAETSELNDRISHWIRRCAGENSTVTWSECFTPIEKLERLLICPPARGPLHAIVVTDHMRRQSHRLPDHHLAAAARNRRLALGAELATRTLDLDGRYHQGPEILALGGRRAVEGPFGPYFGLSQELIDELYHSCLDDEGQELCTCKTHRLLRARGIVHALSHPFDGHDLSLEQTLATIGEFSFIETVNGGFSAQSARMLEAFVELHNRLVCGAILPQEHLSPVGRRIVQQIRRSNHLIFALSGSDSHSHNFDRVRTSLVVPDHHRPEDFTPGDIFHQLLQLEAKDLTVASSAASPLGTKGNPATTASLLADVTAIVLRNVRENLRRCKNPVIWSKFALFTWWVTPDELRLRRKQHRRRQQELKDHFNPVQLLSWLQPAASMGLTQTSPQFPPILPDQRFMQEHQSVKSVG